MRGRTLNDSFIILDEAQNTTIEQMKMFLTRIGFNSKAVITGDPSQIDLPKNVRSGLRHAMEVLDKVDAISFTYFLSDDVVRHPVVAAIVNAYDAWDKKEEALKEREGRERRERRDSFFLKRARMDYQQPLKDNDDPTESKSEYQRSLESDVATLNEQQVRVEQAFSTADEFDALMDDLIADKKSEE